MCAKVLASDVARVLDQALATAHVDDDDAAAPDDLVSRARMLIVTAHGTGRIKRSGLGDWFVFADKRPAAVIELLR